MKIELAKHSGFCIGVRNAVTRIVEEINNCNEEIFIHGSLIHSPQTVSILEKRGLKIITDNESIENKITAIRTHGTTKQQYTEIKKHAKKIINLTCPNVAYVHATVKKYSGKGYFVIILGDKNHSEVQGISSYASNGFFIVSNSDDIFKIPKADKYVLVCQTTLDIDFFNKISAILQKKLKNIEIINTICAATNDRQNDLHQAVKSGVDAIIVVGGKNSANTKRLAQIGLDNNIRTFHIETEDEINPDDFIGIEHIIVSAGASTPSWIVNNVLEKIYSIKYRNKQHFFFLLKSFIEFIIRTNIFSAFITLFMTAAVLPDYIRKYDMSMPFLSSAFIFIMYSINNFFRPYEMQLTKPYKYNLYTRYKHLLITLTILAGLYFLIFSQAIGYPASVIYLIVFVSGFFYAIPSITKIVSTNRIKYLRTLFGIKAVVTSLGWAFIALIIPFIVYPHDYLQFSATFIIIITILFIRNVLIDLIDYQGDLLLGIETLITILGLRKTKFVIIALCLFFTASVFYHIYFINFLAILYILNIAYYYYLYKQIKVNYYFYRFKYEALIDLNLLLFAIISILCTLYKAPTISLLIH
ncbi:MAG: 4-hydroxy-3-methylbut-2-enyl diphosphate reductase [Spirochaetota bacterium]